MNVVLSKVQVVDPTSKFNGQVIDLEIKNGEIVQIGKTIQPSKSKKYVLKGVCISPGWLDIGTHVGEPGFEHRETLESVCLSARRGGYTRIAPMPNTLPVIDTKSQVAYLIGNNAHQVKIHPIGALSQGAKGEDIAELMDMTNQGAVAFSDGHNSVQDSGLMLRALDYVKPFNGLIIDQSEDRKIAPGGQVHESMVSTQMGLQALPSLAESLQVNKHIVLVEHAESRLLFHLITTTEAARHIRDAKKNKINVGATISPFHLCFDEEAIADFDSNKKIHPPLRSKADRKALIKAFQKGTIDILSSHHVPLDPEEKTMAFSDATPGSISLQTTYALLRTHLGEEISSERLIDALAIQPRRWLNLDVPSIKKNNPAELTLFNPNETWSLTTDNNASHSRNTHLLDVELKGKIVGTVIGSDVMWS